MNRWRKFWNDLARRQAQRTKKRPQLLLENLESRELLSAAPLVQAPGPDQHVLILSVDGLHQADIADPNLAADLANIKNLQKGGVTYTNAHTTSPSDSFPGTLSYLTGAGPATTGVFYDDAYSRTLLAPGSNSSATPGTEVLLAENLDKNTKLLSGGGNFDASSIDPSQLPVDAQGHVVYPHQIVNVNTIFDVAHKAGLYTAFSDKHPAYDLVTGRNGNSVNDLYTPEINSFTALYDPSTGKTVNANALLAGAPVSGLTVAAGYNVTSFAANPAGASQPDSIAVDGVHVYVGYGNGVAKDGSDGKSSTIVEYDAAGAIVQSFSVPGHNDGLKVDPSTHLLWALQNEDGSPNLIVIDPKTGVSTPYTLTVVNGGGYDDITFLGGKVYLTASAPANDPNTDPAVVQITLNANHTTNITPVLNGNASATDTVHGGNVTLNLQDPDSMTADKAGNLVLTSQADNELVTIHNPGKASQTVFVTPLSDAANKLPGHGVDDTLFTPSSSGEILVTDKNGAIYRITGPAVQSGLVLSAAQDAGQVGTVNTKTGLFTPVISISGPGSPRGLAFLQGGAFADLSQYTLVDASTDPVGPNDPNLQDTTTNVLLTEKYDDLKVQAILNEIKGLPSHDFVGSKKSAVPAIFAMNFQAVSVAEKDANGGIALVNGKETPSAILEGALRHTDASIGRIAEALRKAGIWDTTELVVTAKHGQTPRVGSAGLIKDDGLTNVLKTAGIGVGMATGDDGSLIWLQNQSQTTQAVASLNNFKMTGTLKVFYQGHEIDKPAAQVIKTILSGKALVDSGLGNPAHNSTSPDLVVVLYPGYILVGDPTKFAHKNAEHGGFSEDDTHVALIVSGGIPSELKGTENGQHVDTKQIAVSALDALGLDPEQLKGAVKEGTKALPGLGQNEDRVNDRIGQDAMSVQKQANGDAKTVKSALEAAKDIGQLQTTTKVQAQLDLIGKSTRHTADDLLAIGASLDKIADEAAGLDKVSDLVHAADQAVADAQKTIDRIKDTTARIDALLKGVKGTIPDKKQDKIQQFARQIAKDEASLEHDDDVIAASAEKILDLVGHGK